MLAVLWPFWLSATFLNLHLRLSRSVQLLLALVVHLPRYHHIQVHGHTDNECNRKYRQQAHCITKEVLDKRHIGYPPVD